MNNSTDRMNRYRELGEEARRRMGEAEAAAAAAKAAGDMDEFFRLDGMTEGLRLMVNIFTDDFIPYVSHLTDVDTAS